MKKFKSFRFAIQLLFLIGILFLGYLHQVKGGGPSGTPSVDALCAFGGAETLYSLITNGTLINRVEISSVVFFIITLIVTVVFGRLFCSFICPLGTVQDISSRIKIKKIRVPEKIHSKLSMLKYVVLIVILFLTYRTGSLIIRDYDPYAALMHLTSAEVFTEFTIGIIILAAIIILSIFIDRFFCRYICPLGAIYAILNKIRPFKVNRAPKCVKCNMCNKNCPMGIDVMSKDKVKDEDCISCLNCMDCPVDAIEVKSKNTRLTASKFVGFSLILALLTFSGFYATGNFRTSTTASEALNQGGEIKTENIKGYMTLEEISKATKIDMEKLYELLKIPSSLPSSTPMKEISITVPEFSVEDSREILQEYLKNK